MCECHVLCLLVAFLIWLPGVVCHGCIAPVPSCRLCLDIPPIWQIPDWRSFSFFLARVFRVVVCSYIFSFCGFSQLMVCVVCVMFPMLQSTLTVFLYVCVFVSVYFLAFCSLAKVARLCQLAEP